MSSRSERSRKLAALHLTTIRAEAGGWYSTRQRPPELRGPAGFSCRGAITATLLVTMTPNLYW
jgi:hypothetical protein